MVQLRDSLSILEEANIQLAGISYDSVSVLREFSDAESIPFPLLSDEESQTIKAFELEFEGGLPHPGTLLIDQDGIIRVKLFKEGYRTRHTVDELIKAVEAMKQ